MLQLGSKGSEVKSLQEKLIIRGYSVGTCGADGDFGQGTYDAVVRFQRDHGLDSDGIVGPATMKAIDGSMGTMLLRKGDRGPKVKELQQKLITKGYSVGLAGADGYFGQGTFDAVIKFQSENELDVDGIIGEKTFEKLDEFNRNNTNNGMKIFIDPGHGGSDPGASANGIIEKEKVLEISMELGNILEEKGFQVRYSRKENSQYIELVDRAKMANDWGADIFLSIHANSFSNPLVSGTEVFSYINGQSRSTQLAVEITNAISNSLNIYNRGAKIANFAVLRESKMPAVLIETAFLTNKSDADILKANSYKFAEAIAKVLNLNI